MKFSSNNIFYFLFCFLFLSNGLKSIALNAFVKMANIDSISATHGYDTSSTNKVTEEEVSKFLSILNNNYLVINDVNAASNGKINIDKIEIENGFVYVQLKSLRHNLNDTTRVLTIRTLQMYHQLLGEMVVELSKWQESLYDQEVHMEAMKEQMTKVRHDTNFIKILSNKNLITQYHSKLLAIKTKWRDADSTNKVRLNRVRFIKNRVSENYINAQELEYNVHQQIEKAMLLMFYKEDPYLWEKNIVKDESIFSPIKTFLAEKKAMRYYFSKQYKTRILMALCAIAFFLWVFKNVSFLKKFGGYRFESELMFLKRLPFLATLIAVLTISPFFDLHTPAVFVEILQLMLMLLLSILFWKRWPRRMFYAWIGIVVFYLLFAFARGLVHLDWIERVIYIGLNIGGIVFIIFFIGNMRRRVNVLPFIKPILILSITLNVLSIFLNLYGRVTLAKTLGAASIYGVTQIVALAIFMRIMTEALYLQVQKSRKKSKFKTSISFEQVSPLFKKVLSFVVIVLWFIFMSVNMNVFDPLYDIVVALLIKSRKLGSITFTFGNLATFALVLYTSFLLQKFTAYFMGIVDNDNVIAENIGKKGNQLLFARLIIIIAGFLFAVTASSLPVDRLTIVFSALGVGIGLGLQNIVSNFVSGVILLFERPFQIGDTIEIGNKIGRVKTISVRSSVIQTDVGSEIIIPNGDLLSQQVTNWTLTNRHVQRDIKFILDGKANFTLAKSLILEIIKSNELVMESKNCSVLIEDINSNYVKIIVQFWLRDISDSDEIRSNFKELIFKKLSENGIEFKAPV